MVAQIFNASFCEAEANRSLEFKVSMVYRASYRTVKKIQEIPVLKNRRGGDLLLWPLHT